MPKTNLSEQASLYDAEFAPESYLCSVWENISKYVSGKVLDIGGNDGRLIARHKGEKYLVEVAEKSISEAKKRGIKAFKADMHKLPFNESLFDTVILINTFEHSSDPKKLLSEIKRVLKKDGNAIIDIPNARSCRQFLNLVRGNPMPAGNSIDYSLHTNHFFQYTSVQLKNILLKSKFRVVRIFGKKPAKQPFKFIFSIMPDSITRFFATDIIAIAKKP